MIRCWTTLCVLHEVINGYCYSFRKKKKKIVILLVSLEPRTNSICDSQFSPLATTIPSTKFKNEKEGCHKLLQALASTHLLHIWILCKHLLWC